MTALLIFFASLAAANVALALPRAWRERQLYRDIWWRLRWYMPIEAIAVLAAVVASYSGLRRLSPIFAWGWFNLLGVGSGNALLAPTALVGRKGAASTNWFVFFFLLVFLVIVPILAKLEEDRFRRGRIAWRQILPTSLYFGMLHCVVGVPIGAGLALSLSGVFYGWKYRRARQATINRFQFATRQAEENGVLASTAYHVLTNSILILFLLLYTLATTLRGMP